MCSVSGCTHLEALALQEPITPENAGERLQTRCERETLSRFPKTGAILFTIRTHMRKLNTFEGRPDKVTVRLCSFSSKNLPSALLRLGCSC